MSAPILTASAAHTRRRGVRIANQPPKQRGLALMMTLLILSSLMVLGLSLTTMVRLEFEEAVMYRTHNEAHLNAQEGMNTAIGFLMYDVWGVNEREPFVCSRFQAGPADGGRSATGRLGDTLITDGGGNPYAFEYQTLPLLAAELELRRVVYENVPANRFDAPESMSLVANWDWVNTNVNGGARVWQFERYGASDAGRSRYTDAFLPTDSDVNDWFEMGLHFNRSDLQGYFRQNFPNRSSDLYAGGYWGGWGHDRSGQPVASYGFGYSEGSWLGDWSGAQGYNFPFAEGHALDNDPVVTGPWNFVNTDQMIGDSFTRVFRYDLVDSQFRNGTYGALCMGPQLTAPDGTLFGGAINLNEVNNNYELESNPGVLAPVQMPFGSVDYDADNSIDPISQGDERFYYSGRSYHYNEAKWIYTYNAMGKPAGRYAVTILPDGGLPNVNGLGNPRYMGLGGWYPITVEWPGVFPDFDRGYNVYGQSLYARKSYASADNTAPDGPWAGNWYVHPFRLWSDEVGANRIKNGGINTIRKPGMLDLYDNGIDANYYTIHDLKYDGQYASPKFFRIQDGTNQWKSEVSYGYSVFASATGHLNHPKMLTYFPGAAAEWYAGPRQDAGNLKIMGQGLISHTFWHILAQGPIRTRAEFMMLLKKRAFMIDDENDNGMAANGIDENPRGNGVFYDTEDFEIAENDCEYLAGWLTPIGYSYTLDHQWNRDRVVIDSTGDLFMGGSPEDKSACYFWSGIGSQSRAQGDPASRYEGDCPVAAADDPAGGPGIAPALAPGDLSHHYKNMYRQVKGKSGAKALLQTLAQLRYAGAGLGRWKGGLTPYSPTAQRLAANGSARPGFDDPALAVRRADKAGAQALAYLLSTIRLSNKDAMDSWRQEFRIGETAGVRVHWQQAGGGWDPDISIWPNMHWRQAWEVSSVAETAPDYGSFVLHQYVRSTLSEVGRARVYPPYYQNDLDGDGRVTGNQDFRTPLDVGSDRRLFFPQYTDIPYNQWMDHLPSYPNDPVPLGWRQVWNNQTVPIAAAAAVDPVTGLSYSGFTKVTLVADAQWQIRVRTEFPSGVRPGDTIRIAGATEAAYNRDFIVLQVNGPNSFDIYLPKADGDPSPAVSGGGQIDRRLTTDPHLAVGVDTRYPGGIPLVMNYIELCLNYAHRFAHQGMDENEIGESLCNKTWRQSYMPNQMFRMWVTDTNAANDSGWTNRYDGTALYMIAAAANQWDANRVRIHAGSGNSQPFLYVKGRLMQMDPANPANWYLDPTGKPGVAVLVNMLDPFDPVHAGVSVREANAGGGLNWVTYNNTALEQRAIRRIFGRMTDITWGLGEDRIPAGNNSIDNGYRWSTRTGNRGMFIRAHSPMLMQRGVRLAPNWLGSVGNRAYPFESYLIDMPVALAMRQLVEKHVDSRTWGGPQNNIVKTNPWDDVSGGQMNFGAYLNSYSWFTVLDTFGQDCDWRAFHWWAMDGNIGAAAYAGGPAIQYDGRAPILPWKWEWDHSIDGRHEAFMKTGAISPQVGLHSPAAGNASHQAMTQGHPEQFKVIYFHPYFFPQKVVYGVRSRELCRTSDCSRYYDYFYPRHTVDNGVAIYNRNIVKSISRAAGTVTVQYTGDWNQFFGQGSANSGTPVPAGGYVRIEDCPDPSFNGVYPVLTADGSGNFTYRQEGLPDRTLNASGSAIDSSPVGFATRHTAFARVFNGGQFMDADAPVGGSWGDQVGAPVLAAPADLRTAGFGSNTWYSDCRAYFPVDHLDFAGSNPVNGGNANAQSPVELVERVHGLSTLPDYLGENNAAFRAHAQQLWTKGPWWTDGDEAQGPVYLNVVAGLVADDWVQTGNGARGRVVTVSGGKNGSQLVIEPSVPTTAAFTDGDSLGRIDRDPTSPGFLTATVLGAVANVSGQRLWYDYGRYNTTTIPTLQPMDYVQLDPVKAPYSVPPASAINTYLRGVLEFSLSTPWVLDNQDSAMWQFNSAWGFKAAATGSLATDPAIYGSGAASRIDPAFGAVRWYLARGTDHACQVFSLPTPGQRNSNHIAWSASPLQRDRWANGVEEDPNRPGAGGDDPGFRRHNGRAAGSPVSQWVENKLELAVFLIGNAAFNYYKSNWYTTPIGRLSADESDIHELCWWDLAESTALDSAFELGVFNGSNETRFESRTGAPGFLDMGKDPLSPGNGADTWAIADWSKKYDLAQMYTNNTSYNDLIDNQDQGIREILTRTPLRAPNPPSGRVEGHFNADRQTVFKLNPNLMPSPMLYQWITGDYVGQTQPTYVFGNKPARGYVSTPHLAWYAGSDYSGYHLTHWNSRIWYKNQCAGPSAFNDYYGVSFLYEGYGRMSNMATYNPAPVYTLLITGESVSTEGHPVAQMRLSVGVERTWDGKCNVLEYQIRPGMVQIR